MEQLLYNVVVGFIGAHLLWFAFGVVVATLTFCAWRVRHDVTLPLAPLAVPPLPDPYEVAYLRGGEQEIMRLVVFDLLQRGYLEFRDIPTSAQKTETHIAASACYPGVATLTLLEREVFATFASPLTLRDLTKSSLPMRVGLHCASYRMRLHQEQLLLSDEAKQRIRRCVWISADILIGFTLGLLPLAFRYGVTPAFLLMSGLGLAALIASGSAPRLSHRGRVYLDRLHSLYALPSSCLEHPFSARTHIDVFGAASFPGASLICRN